MRRQQTQRGFSLIELLVAMTVTLIITGAIYGLIVGGQNAFRREPALTERQQSVRMAMDSIVRDIENAGSFGASPFDKVFTEDDPPNSMNDPAVALGSWPAAMGPVNTQADFLEMLVNDGACPGLSVCAQDGTNLFLSEPFPSCMTDPALAYVYGPNGGAVKDDDEGPTGIVYVMDRDDSPGGPPTCPNAAAHINTPAGQAWLNPGGTLDCGGGQCTGMVAVQLVRYEIAPCTAAGAENLVPCLWRSPVGRTNMADGSLGAGPPGGQWQQIARGIEDMQVQYRRSGAWLDDPGLPQAAPPDYDTVVTAVRVTLSARAEALNLGTAQAGLTTAAWGGVVNAAGRLQNPVAVRGRLSTVVSPRAMLRAMSIIHPASPSPTPSPVWN